MTSYNDFGSDLSKILKLVWKNKTKLGQMTPDDQEDFIYCLYAGILRPKFFGGLSEKKNPYKPSKSHKLNAFLGQIQRIQNQSSCSVVVQVNKGEAFKSREQILRRVAGRRLWGTFYHFLAKGQGKRTVQKRIYINAKNVDPAGLRIMAKLVGKLDVNLGFYAIKIVGPGGQDRFDTIVAYLRDRKAVDYVLNFLRTDKVFAPWLGSKRSSGVGAVEGLKGVGVANEPLGAVKEEYGSSYGSVLASFIIEAFNKKHAGQESEPDLFLENLWNGFRKKGVNPKSPHFLSGSQPVVHFEV